MTSARLHALAARVTVYVIGICLDHPLPRADPSCPFDGLTFPTASLPRSITTHSGAGLSYLLAIAYDCHVLGLGPDSPWDD